jgi:hypothetical protein
MKKFFRVIWRINAILICLCGVLLVALLGFGLFSMISETFAQRGSGSVPANPATAADKNASKLSVSKVENLDGTTIVRGTIDYSASEGRGGASFSSGYDAGTTCNYVFYDTVTDQVSTLLAANNCVIVKSDDFYFPSEPCDKRVTKWTSYVVADKDTNGDGVISDADLKSFAVAQASGQDYHVYLTDLDEVLNTQLMGESDFYVYYEKGGNLFVSRLDLANKKIVQTKKLF